MSANDRQVGGDHYKTRHAPGQEQHWDRMWRLCGRGYFIGQITRYAERYHLKNGLQDLDKIVHYTEKLKELEQAWIDGSGPPPGDAGSSELPDVRYRYATKPPEFVPIQQVVIANAPVIPETEPCEHDYDLFPNGKFVCVKCQDEQPLSAVRDLLKPQTVL